MLIVKVLGLSLGWELNKHSFYTLISKRMLVERKCGDVATDDETCMSISLTKLVTNHVKMSFVPAINKTTTRNRLMVMESNQRLPR